MAFYFPLPQVYFSNTRTDAVLKRADCSRPAGLNRIVVGYVSDQPMRIFAFVITGL